MSEEEIREHLCDVYEGGDWDFLVNYIMSLQDELEWYKQQCDDLEMQIGCEEQ